MKNMKKIGVVAVSAVMLLSMLTACGKPSTLEEAIEKDKDAKAEIEQIGEENGMEITVKGNVVTYTVQMNSEVDDSLVDTYKSALDEAFKGEEDTMVNAVKDIEKSTEIDGIEFEIVCKDSTGKQFYSCKFNNKGME